MDPLKCAYERLAEQLKENKVNERKFQKELKEAMLDNQLLFEKKVDVEIKNEDLREALQEEETNFFKKIYNLPDFP